MAVDQRTTETMGERIKTLRLRKGWSQEELGFRIGMSSKATISMYENDRRSPDISVLPELARALDTDIDYLVTGREEKENPELLMAIRILRDFNTEQEIKAALGHLKVISKTGL